VQAARAGKIKNFTGIDDPYEEPDAAEIVVDAKDATASWGGESHVGDVPTPP
jgi:adenylylsulfate kinase-like enzyme